MQKENYLYLFKYILVGDSSVGKSCILLSFQSGQFRQRTDPTIGLNFCAKSLTINDKIIKLHLYDTAGAEQFKSLTRQYFKSTIGCIFVYDVGSLASFHHLEQWIQEAKENSNFNSVGIIVGNKNDLSSQQRQVTYSQGEQFAQSHNMMFIETSAKTNTNIELCFNQLTEQIYQNILTSKIDVKQLLESGVIKQGIEYSNLEIDPRSIQYQIEYSKKKQLFSYCKC